MAEDSPKRRKANFNEAETEVLVEQVLRHERVLFAAAAAGPGRRRRGGGASPGQKRKVWELIRHKVNPVAACPREVEDLKKRWRDLKRRDRGRLCRSGGAASASSAAGEEASSPPESRPDALPISGGIDTLDLPGGFADDPGPSRLPYATEKINLEEDIVVKVVEPPEGSSEDVAALPPPQPHETTEQDLLHVQRHQLRVVQSGFESVNRSLRLLQQGVCDLNRSLDVMAHTLVAIKDVYVKNHAGPATLATVTTQTATGYLSPGSPPAEDGAGIPVPRSSSSSSSCSSSSIMSQDPGPSEFPRPPHRPIKKEHPNGCYYFCFADVHWTASLILNTK